VLIVHPRDPAAPTLGGIQTFLGDFIKYSPPDFDLSIVGLTADPAVRPVGKWLPLTVRGRTVSFLPLGTTKGIPRAPRPAVRTASALVRLWSAVREDGRIMQLHRPYRAALVARHHGPSVQFIHLDVRDWPGPAGWPKLQSLYRQFSDGTLERMARVFVVNEPGAKLLRAEHPKIADRVEFLPVWYDEDVFHPVDDEARRALRAELVARLELDPAAIDTDRFVLVAMRLTEIKKPLKAIETLAALTGRSGQTVRMVVAGSGELLDASRKRAAELRVSDRVHFMGDVAREEVARLMQALDVLLLTSRSEGGGPRVVLEALACGMPVVSTSVVEIRRTVTSGVNGWLVDEAGAQQMAEGVEWVLAQPREVLAPAAMAAAEPFTARRILAGLYETYRELVRGEEPRR
jgi:glycosyltransferase involved in cell wall biosynthesis